jgi:hypothetical protein
MLHACFTPIALCFVYTSWHFYAFSGTNLLTRCHSASSCFLLFLYFRKVIQEIFSELDKTKAEVPIYLTRRWSPKERQSWARRWPHHRVAWPHPGRTRTGVGPPGALWHRPLMLRGRHPVGNPKRKVWWAQQQVSLSMKLRFNRTSRRKNQLPKVDTSWIGNSSRQFIYGALSRA